MSESETAAQLSICLKHTYMGFPGGSVVKNSPTTGGDVGSVPGLRKIPWRRKWQPTAVPLLGKSKGQRAWQATVPGIAKESDMT